MHNDENINEIRGIYFPMINYENKVGGINPQPL